MNKDKIILVIKVGVRDLMPEQICELCAGVQRQLVSNKDFHSFVIPSYNQGKEITIDCINPKLISEKEYTKVKDLIKESEELLSKFKEKI